MSCLVFAGCGGEKPPDSSALPATALQGTGSTSATPTRLQAAMMAAESTYYRGEYDSARTRWENALPDARAARDTAAEARALTWLGLTARAQGRYADSRRLGEQALALKLRAGLTRDLFRSYNALGLLAHHQGRFTEAMNLFTKAAESARAVNDSLSEGKAIGNLGLVQSDVGDLAKARDGFETMRRAGSAFGDRRVEANALNNLGMVAVRSGDTESAMASLDSALKLYRSLPAPLGEENSLGQLGMVYQARGDLQRAFAYLDSALAVARKHGLRQAEVDDLSLMAGLFDEAGEHARALEYLSRADSANRDLEMQSEAGDIARAQAQAYAALGRWDLAGERITVARQRHDSAGALLERLRDEVFSAELSQRNGRSADALNTLATARRTTARLAHPVAHAELALGEARVFDASNDAAAVIRVLGRSRATLSSLGDDKSWQADALEARARARAGQLAEAIAAGRRALSKVERIRSGLAAGSLRSSYTADKARVYSDLVVVLLRAGRMEEAFEVADAARGRALLDHISAAGREVRSRTPRQLAEADQLLRRIDVLMERLRAGDTTLPRQRSVDVDAEFGSLSKALTKARGEYEALMQRVAQTDPSGARLLGVSPVNAIAVRGSLRNGEALIEFYAAPERLITFVVTRSATRVFESAVRELDLVGRVRLARDLAAEPGGNDAARRATLVALHELLVAPVERSGILTGASKLVVVPHGALVYLPMATLINGSTNRALIQDYSVLVLPSAAALPAVRAGTHASSEAITMLAPFPDELPGTREESRIADRARQNTSFVGARATERAAREALESSAFVHFATHGILNVRNPMFSRLELVRGSGQLLSSNDGRLEVHELLDLQVRSPLVFLSGCETGVGSEWSTSFRRGEDYATLAQAFLFAGARNVIATLWRIEDRGAAVFAAEFYRQLETADPAEALARTQRAMQGNRTYSAPYYWAGYVLSGSGDLQRTPQKAVELTVK
jgi:CHAT domain-containing protein/Tfp pilus assembly protein PilF